MKVHVSQAIPSYLGYPPPDFNRQLPFVDTLDFLDLNQLTNNPIAHSPWWLIIPTKFPYDIPKCNGNLGEDLSMHIMKYHLWCSSNSLKYDSIRIHLFQRMLTGTTAKWYIELPRASFHDFNTLV